MLPKVAIVGRPNVGKSTLFNRLTKSRASIIDSKPGVTRDRLYGEVYWGKVIFELIDTGGIIPDDTQKLTQEIKKQVTHSIKESDLILFLVDGEEGLHNWDEEICQLLRKTGKPIILVVNKIEGNKREALSGEFYKMGFPDTISISAIHGLNINELMEKILVKIPKEKTRNSKPEIRNKIMIVGHPNVGKSTLINKLFGSQRVIVHDVPGTTRDIVEIPFSLGEDKFMLLDTSGIRREGRIREGLEKVAVKKTKKAIADSDMVFFLLDMSLGIIREDLSIGSFLEEHAKAVIILLNKSDLIPASLRPAPAPKQTESKTKNIYKKGKLLQPEKSLDEQEEYLIAVKSQFNFLDFAPFIFTSGVTGKNLEVALTKAKEIILAYKKPITRPQLAEALVEIKAKRMPRQGTRIYDLTQNHSRPNNIILRTNNPSGIDKTYLRFITHHLHKKFGLEGIPLIIKVRNTKIKRKKK
ncbi:ribosome biogenesis GTPase Der [bacterium]|nr:ribosome biogenesis GTPase Der [bacterium]